VNVNHLVSSDGYWAVFALVIIESLGVPLPGETALIVAGAYAGSTHKLNPWLIFVVAVAAVIIGNNIGYLIGDKGGYPLAVRYGSKIRLDERKLKVARYLFDRQGGKVVFFGRFVAILRTYAAFLAGTSQMRWRHFMAATVAGGAVWAGIYTIAAYFAGTALERDSGTLSLILGIVAVVVIVVAVFLVRHQINRLADRAEAAYPGPLAADHGRRPHRHAAGHDRDVRAQPASSRPRPDQVSRGEREERVDPGSDQPTRSPPPDRRG
jgi:membrane protein DedA with SNARE-associated domain